MQQAHRVTRPSLGAIVLRVLVHLVLATITVVGLWAVLVGFLIVLTAP